MGLEILEQTPDVEAIVVPVGGGGLHRGHRHGGQGEGKPAVSRRSASSPSTRRASPRRSRQGQPVTVPLSPTLADGLAVAQLGDAPFAIAASASSTRVVTVDEATIALAILRLIELEKSVVEGAGAAPLAAFLAGKLDTLKGKRVVLVLCGGNIDLTMLDRVIEVGPRRRRPALRASPSRSATGPAASRGSPRSSRRPARRSRRSCTTARSRDRTCPRCASSASSRRRATSTCEELHAALAAAGMQVVP